MASLFVALTGWFMQTKHKSKQEYTLKFKQNPNGTHPPPLMSLKHANQRPLAHSDWSQQTQLLAMPRQTSEDRGRVYPLLHFEWSSQVRPIACDLLTGQ